PNTAGGRVLTVLVGDKAENIAEVTVEKPDGAKLVLRRAGKDAWVVDAPVKARADKAAVEAGGRSGLRGRPTPPRELQDNLAVHGLDKALKVTLTTEDGRTETVNVGDVTIGGAKAVGFVTTAARPRPMAVPKSSLDALLKEAGSGVRHAAETAKWAA